jgi:beta-lactamase class A
MTLAELCAAAVTLSDNTAANLLLAQVGGPAGLTQFARGLGDDVTRFDRTEPDLNSNTPGDPRDTTTPMAMAGLLRTVYTGAVLRPDSLAQLKTWMLDCQTGLKEIRVGVPAGWTVADKTGRGNGAVNDVAVVWPKDKTGKDQAPVFLAIYTTGGTLSDDDRNQIIADTAKLVFDSIGFAESLGKSSTAA